MLGAFIGSLLIIVFSAFNPQWIGDTVLSSMTYFGFGVTLFGWFYKRNGEKNFTADFLLGLGIGLLVVWFVGAGNGTLTYTDIAY